MNKLLRNIAIPAIIFCVLAGAGCKKGWIDINYNPRQLTENSATPDLILPPLLLSEVSTLAQSGLQWNQWMGYWSYPRNTSGTSLQTYLIQDSKDFPSMTLHTDILMLERNAIRQKQPFYIGIAKVLKANDWGYAVDLINSLPYRQANIVTIVRPEYDDGQFIYEDLIKQLDSAITLIGDAPVDKAIKLSASDIMFRGDKKKWFRYINTLKLRLLIRQANLPGRESYIKAEIAKIQAQGSGFLLSGEDASVNPGFNDQKPAPYFGMYSPYDVFNRFFLGVYPWWEGGSANVTALNFLKADNDPRLGFFYNPPIRPLPAGAVEPFTQPNPQTYRGNRFGLNPDAIQFPYQQAEYVSQVGGVKAKGVAVSPTSTGIIKGYNMNCWMMTSIESMFFQAEAIWRGWLPGDPETAYKNAVKESFRWLNVGGNSTAPALSDAAFDTWYSAQSANARVNWSAAPDKYKLIMFQKYMALNGIAPFESYCDYRRNGAYPAIPLSYDPARVSDKMPIRSLYPLSEYTMNKENVDKQGTIDVFNTQIWWMP